MHKSLLVLGLALLATACDDAGVTSPTNQPEAARASTVAMASLITDNGDGTATIVFQPSRGLNNGTDEGGLTTGKDAYVREFGATDYSSGVIPWHMHFNSDCNGHHSYSLYRFNVTDLPDPSHVISARVELFHMLFNFNTIGWPTPTTTFAVFPVLSPWNELTVKWATRPTLAAAFSSVTLAMTTPIPLYGTAVAWYEDWASVDVTGLYATWKNNPESNHGFAYQRMNQFCEASTATWTYTASSDMQDGLPGWLPSSASWRPKLVVTYRTNQAPSVEILPPVGSLIEGSPFTLIASGTDPDGDLLSYTWTVDGVAAGTDPTLPLWYGDTGVHTARVTVTDGKGGSASAQYVFLVADVPPTVQMTFDREIVAGETAHGSGTIIDPGLDSWTGTMDFGDGTTIALVISDKAFTLSHVYATAGTFAWRVWVYDDDGGWESPSGTITVLSGAQVISRMTVELNAALLSTGLHNSLVTKLDNASKSLKKGNENAARGQLGAFKNEINAAAKTNRMPADVAAVLLALTDRLLAVL